jgi:hypothetical protein
LPEALARSHNDSILARPARQTPVKSRGGVSYSIVRWFLALPARSIAGATLAAILVGIVVNALALQKERHPAPLFAPKPVAQERAVAPEPAALAAPAETTAIAVQPPVRPANLGATPETSVPALAHANDPIRDLLRGEPVKDAARLTLEAQNALLKLGYSVKADGRAGAATTAAIQQFEHAHGLAASTEITPRLVKQLTAAAATAAAN